MSVRICCTIARPTIATCAVCWRCGISWLKSWLLSFCCCTQLSSKSVFKIALKWLQPSPVEKVANEHEDAVPTVNHPEQQQQTKQLGDVKTAKMETISELDLAPILPSDRVLRTVANAVTCTENELANCKIRVSHPSMLSGDDPPPSGSLTTESAILGDNGW